MGNSGEKVVVDTAQRQTKCMDQERSENGHREGRNKTGRQERKVRGRKG